MSSIISNLQKKGTVNFFKGNLGSARFCAKSNGEFCLFVRRCPPKVILNPAVDSIEGFECNDDRTLKTCAITFKKGEFYEIRNQMYTSPLVFNKGAKVLSLKPTTNGNFTVKFYPATVVSEAKACKRECTTISSNMLNVRKNTERHEYEVKFDDDPDKTYHVFEELIVPLEKDWGNIKDTYPAEENKETKIEESKDSDSSDSKDEKDEKKKKRHHKHHKHHSHSKKEKNHDAETPQVIVIPIIIPYGSYQQQIPFFY